MSATEPTGAPTKKHLTMRNGIGLVVGGIIGSGIFLTPNGVLEQSGSVGAALSIWVLAGVFSLCGALCYCELGTSIPETGGEHVYFQRAFGPLTAFTFTWSLLLVVSPMSTALICLTFSRYAIKPFYNQHAEVPEAAETRLAAAAIVLLTFINCVSAKWATRIADSFTALKLVAIAFLVMLGAVWAGKGNVQHFDRPFVNSTINMSTFNLGFFEALYPFTGWNYLNYVTGEMTHPARDLPRAVVFGMLLVILCYLLCNLAYFTILSKAVILETKAIAVTFRFDGGFFITGGTGAVVTLVALFSAIEAMVKVIGDVGLLLGPFFVATSCWGAANSSVYAAGRVGYAAALEGHMPKVLALVHRQYATPFISLLFQGLLSLGFLMINMDSLVLVFGFLTWVFFGAAFLAVLCLRRSEPDLERPYKVNALLPAFMSVASLALVVSSISQFPQECFGAVGFLLVGVGVYYVFIKHQMAASVVGPISDRSVSIAQRLFQLELGQPDDT